MNAATRSRRDSTSGEGLKSIIWTLRHPAIAGEQLALGFEQPGELHLLDVGQGALQDPRALAAGDLRGDREEELVRETALAQAAVEGRAAFAEHGLDATLLEQPGEGAVELDTFRMAHDRHRR